MADTITKELKRKNLLKIKEYFYNSEWLHKPFVVKIIKSSKQFWYYEKIGEEITVTLSPSERCSKQPMPGKFLCDERPGYLNFGDCEILYFVENYTNDFIKFIEREKEKQKLK